MDRRCPTDGGRMSVDLAGAGAQLGTMADCGLERPAGTLKRSATERGGNAPFLAFEGAGRGGS